MDGVKFMTSPVTAHLHMAEVLYYLDAEGEEEEQENTEMSW